MEVRWTQLVVFELSPSAPVEIGHVDVEGPQALARGAERLDGSIVSADRWYVIL